MSLAPVYIFSCDDPFLKNEKSSEVIAKARAQMPDATFMIFTGSDFSTGATANLAKLENELIDPGLFGGDRIIKIYLNITKGELNAIAVQVLQLIAKRHREGVVIVIEIDAIAKSYNKVAPATTFKDNLSKKDDAKDVIANIKGIGGILEIMDIPVGEAFPQWILNTAQRKYQLTLEQDALQTLAMLTEGNLVAVDQFLLLVKTTTNVQIINSELVNKYLSQNSRFDENEFTFAVLKPDTLRALNILSSLCATSSNLSTILSNIVSHFDRVLQAIDNARGRRDLFTNFKVRFPFFRQYRLFDDDSQKMVIFAAQNMPMDFYDYLVSELNNASTALQNFDQRKALIALQNMAVSTCYKQVRDLKPL